MLWTLQRSRCWDTGRGLAERIALGHAPKTLSYSDPLSALCNYLTNYDFIESLTHRFNALYVYEASVGLQDEGWLGELLYCVP